MQDLFGQEVAVYKGQPTDTYEFTEEDADKITDEVIYEGLLLKQMAYNLERLKRASNTKNLTPARQEGWEELIWAFDLWETPACVSFDIACEVMGIDSEQIRGQISQAFGDEIRFMFATIVDKCPTERQRFIKKLCQYVDLNSFKN